MIFNKLNIVCFWIVISLSFIIQDSEGQGSNITFKHLSTTDGLSNFTVLSITQDQQGFMWFGTMDGLNRFDGKQIKTYREDPEQTNALGNNYINSLNCASDSGIWVGTSRGLYYYNFKFDNFRLIPITDESGTEFTNLTIRALEYSGHYLWIGTNQGLFRYNLSTSTFNSFELHGQANWYIKALKKAKDGSIWIGHTNGLSIFRQGKFDIIPIESPRDMLLDVISIEMDDDGKVWIGTSDLETGIFIYDPDTHSQIRLSKNQGHLPHNRANCIFRFDERYIWVGTTWGLSIIDQKTLQSRHLLYTKENPGGISQNSIKAIYQDKNGNIWIGTYSGGVNYFDPKSQQVTHISDKNDDGYALNFNIVSSIYEDKNKNLWIGTEYGGVNIYDHTAKKFRVIMERSGSNSLISDNIKSILEDSYGRFFIATQFGLSIYKPESDSFINITDKTTRYGRLNYRVIHDVCEDEYGNIWIGPTGEYAHFQMYDMDRDTLLHFFPPKLDFPTIQNTFANSVIYDAKHKIVWGGGNNGLAGFDIEARSYVTNDEFLPAASTLQNVIINDLVLDSNGLLWIATFGRGLFIMDSETFQLRKIDRNEGLSESSFYALVEDDDRDIWTSVNSHLLKIKQSGNFSDPVQMVEKYGIQEGFPPQQYFRTAKCKGADGTLYFGGDNGFISFDPRHVQNIVLNPSVVITDILVNGESLQVPAGSKSQYLNVASLSGISLTYEQSSFSIQFIAPNYINPDNTFYQYKLSGVHDTWQELGNSNAINFTELKADDYEFRLRASSDPDSFVEEYSKIRISVAPAPWATPIAFALYVIIVLIMLYVFFIISRNWERINQNLKMEHYERERENVFHQRRIKFFTDISHELRTPLTLILAPIDRLIKSNMGNAQIKNQLMLMLRNGERMLQLINQLLDLRKLETGHMQLQVAKGNISIFIKEVSLSFKELAERRGIKFRFESHPDKIGLWFDRDKFEIIFFNLLSNALKFTPDGGLISILVEETDSEKSLHNNKEKLVSLKVSNTGRGIPGDQIKHVFERFYTGDTAPTHKNFSSGVGLEIVEKLVGLHHGSISVQSDYDDKGNNGNTTFILTLPKDKSHFGEHQLIKKFKNSDDISTYGVSVSKEHFQLNETKLLEENQRGDYEHSILIVEDNAEVRSLIVDIFCREYFVYIAADGKQGLDIAMEKIPDLIISDVMMPEMDGIELCKRLKGDVITSHIPVILLTARTAVTFKYEGLETGADDYIVKPFNVEDLKIRTINLIRQRQHLKEKFTQNGSFIPSDITTTSVDEKFMGKVRDYIIENIGTDRLTVEKIAEETGMSRANFYRKIKMLTNMSAAEFLKKIKMDHAAQLLKTNKFRVSEVQSIIGIADGDYFRKCFRLQFGMAPKDYVDQHKE